MNHFNSNDLVEPFAEELSHAILQFQPLLTRLTPQVSTRIELYMHSQPVIRKLVQTYSKEEGASMTLAELSSQTPDLPARYCRASLIVHLSALVSTVSPR